jgi:transcription-repair coupling factor (superfamily II helicase)
MLERLRGVVPELSIAMAHGRMRGEELDRVVLAFAEGEGDVLLTTNIVETGLDLPNANTMLIWRADRFGLAQLHQLRGRIGRGRVRASAYLLTDAEHPPSATAQKRLEAVVALQHLGAGFDISIADLEQRGAGDLLGEDQAGHIRLIGTELYRGVLSRALARARGERVEEDWTPEIVVNAEAHLPTSFVPEPDTLEIYRRLARIETSQALEDIAEELADRFGDPPEPTTTLIELVRLRLLCQNAGVTKVLVGPQGVAITWHNGDHTVIDTSGEPTRAGLQRAFAVIQRDRS